jgi:hypothetical protein
MSTQRLRSNFSIHLPIAKPTSLVTGEVDKYSTAGGLCCLRIPTAILSGLTLYKRWGRKIGNLNRSLVLYQDLVALCLQRC